MGVETIEYLGAVERFIRAAGRRVAEADEIELARLVALRSVLEQAIQEAIDGWREMGRSWSEIGSALGVSKQAAEKRYGKEKAA